MVLSVSLEGVGGKGFQTMQHYVLKDREWCFNLNSSSLGTKLAQAKKFNDPNDPCKILVATDAIGMGLNL